MPNQRLHSNSPNPRAYLEKRRQGLSDEHKISLARDDEPKLWAQTCARRFLLLLSLPSFLPLLRDATRARTTEPPDADAAQRDATRRDDVATACGLANSFFLYIFKRRPWVAEYVALKVRI
jgi:hypothetical protein